MTSQVVTPLQTPVRLLLPPVGFRARDVTPPSAFYVRQGDKLFLLAYNSVSGVRLEVRGLVLLPEGELVPFSYGLTPSTDRSSSTLFRELPEGFLLNLAVFNAAGTLRRGQCYVLVGVLRGTEAVTNILGVLARGYVAEGHYPSWPYGLQEHSLSGPGVIRSITGTDPAAGSEWSETVPTNARWRLLGVRASLVTSGVGSARRVTLIIDDGTTTLLQMVTNVTQAISTTITYNWGPTMPTLGTTVASDVYVYLPPYSYLFQGYRIRSSTATLDAADNWGAPQLWVEELIED